MNCFKSSNDEQANELNAGPQFSEILEKNQAHEQITRVEQSELDLVNTGPSFSEYLDKKQAKEQYGALVDEESVLEQKEKFPNIELRPQETKKSKC